MDSRNLELAAEFCKLVGAPDLLAYLGLPGEVDSAEARRKLKARRKYMQGMQGNPKYKHEALYLIKHFAALDAVLGDPGDYLVDAQRRAESVHTPILEMTIKGVLTGGSLTADQEDYLRRNAIELGVSVATFDELLERLTTDAGVPRPSVSSSQPPGEWPGASPTRSPGGPSYAEPPVGGRLGNAITDPGPLGPVGHDFGGKPTGLEFYRVLDIPPSAGPAEIEEAWRRKRAQLERLPASANREELKVRLDLAWNVLRDQAAREQYDLASSRTGPPARARIARPDQAATAPPVRQRSMRPGAANTPATPGGRPARLEVDGDPARRVRTYGKPVVETITVRNIGDEPLAGTLVVDVPWMRVSPSVIDPDLKEQEFRVVVDASALEADVSQGRVHIQTDAGDATVEFQLVKADPRVAAAVAGAAVLVVILIVAALGLLLFSTAGPGSSGLTIRVDPTAAEVRLDGQQVGNGSLIVVEEPPLGTVTLTVAHPNFAPYTREIVVERGRAQTVDVALELARDMSFRPSDRLAKGAVDADTARAVVGARGSAIDGCLRSTARVGQILTGTVRVHIDKEGRAAGFEVQGKNVGDEAVQGCLARQAAAITFEPLARGDYATVRYDYTVTADPDAP